MFFSKKIKDNQNWVSLEDKDQLGALLELSKTTPVLFFKHSTRCSISSMALNRLNQGLDWSLKCNFSYLDLLSFRFLSNFAYSPLSKGIFSLFNLSTIICSASAILETSALA